MLDDGLAPDFIKSVIIIEICMACDDQFEFAAASFV